MNWENYWSTRTYHENKTDAGIIKKRAKEHIYHMPKGGKILDFGCGDCDITQHYINHFEYMICADFSQSMLSVAKKRDTIKSNDKVGIINADNNSIWNMLPNIKLNYIISCQVIQYLSIQDIESFIIKGKAYLEDDGQIIFFDIIDPGLSIFLPSGYIYGKLKGDPLVKPTFLFKLIISWFRRLMNYLHSQPAFGSMGYTYDPNTLKEVAQKCGYDCEIVYSMYFGYRYHAILTKN